MIAAAPALPDAGPLGSGGIDPWAAVARSGNPEPIEWPYVIDVTTSALGWQRRE